MYIVCVNIWMFIYMYIHMYFDYVNVHIVRIHYGKPH